METSDVVVVGSGGAGMMAALRSAVGGAQVTVLEVSDLFGGTSAISGGGMWLPRTRLAAEAGIEDSRDEVKRYLTYLTSGVTDEAVIDRFIDTAPSIIDFIEEHTALRFYVDCERPDYKTTFPGAADAGRLDQGAGLRAAVLPHGQHRAGGVQHRERGGRRRAGR